jgi:hypothetical protein
MAKGGNLVALGFVYFLLKISWEISEESKLDGSLNVFEAFVADFNFDGLL